MLLFFSIFLIRYSVYAAEMSLYLSLLSCYTKSSINMLNESGELIAPCGTPYPRVHFFFFSTKVRVLQKNFCRLIVPSLIFFLLNFSQSFSWLMELNAPLKSIKRHHYSFLLLLFLISSSLLIKFCTMMFILISVPSPLLKPVCSLAFLAPYFAVAASNLCFKVWSICFMRGGCIVIGLLFLKLGGSKGSLRICTCLTRVYFSCRVVTPVSIAVQYFCRFEAIFVLNYSKAFFMYQASSL